MSFAVEKLDCEAGPAKQQHWQLNALGCAFISFFMQVSKKKKKKKVWKVAMFTLWSLIGSSCDLFELFFTLCTFSCSDKEMDFLSCEAEWNLAPCCVSWYCEGRRRKNKPLQITVIAHTLLCVGGGDGWLSLRIPLVILNPSRTKSENIYFK